jgi:hypothetical protein
VNVKILFAAFAFDDQKYQIASAKNEGLDFYLVS